jgi:hypothetical protein
MATATSSTAGTPVGPGREGGTGPMGLSDAGGGAETAGGMAGLAESVRSFISTADEALHARRVFGDPIERGGITVIRCARHGRRRNRDGPDAGRPSEGREATGQTGTGGGFGVRA